MLYVIQNMLWCAKQMFVRYMKYALVCKMNVYMLYEICFGVQNECRMAMKFALVCKMNVVCTMKYMLWCAVMNSPTQLSRHSNMLESLKIVIENKPLCSLFTTQWHKNVTLCI